MTARTPRLAIIGCGAAAERLHLPALAALRIAPALLVDANLRRAEMLANGVRTARAADTFEPWLDDFDAAIVAVPHHLHAPVCCRLLRRGIHVLVEKPLALTTDECAQIVTAARESGAVLAVGLMRRFLNRLQWVKSALDAGALGSLESFTIREGCVYRWPVASSFFFRRETAGGGVLADTGAHTMDLVLWWFGAPSSTAYRDDNRGGVEADCRVELGYPGGVTGLIELSRTRDLSNSAIVRGTRGSIEVRLDDTALDVLTSRPEHLLDHQHRGVAGHRLAVQRFRELFPLQIADWLTAIATGTPPMVGGEEAARAVALVESCYRRREALVLPWEADDADCPAQVGTRLAG